MAVKFVSDEKIAETSSKGNQEKWYDNGRWYKLDQFGYEALAETVVSALLSFSNIGTELPFRFVHYSMERMLVHGRERTGCSSPNFLRPGESIITLSHLYKRESERPLPDILSALPSDKKRLAFLAEETAKITGLERFPQYLTLLFEIDALILNDDRHLNNIAVIERNGEFDYCPVFDNGAGLLSNVQTAPMDIAHKALIRSARARPFHTTFNRQIITVRNLYGPQLKIPKFSQQELLALLRPALEFYPGRDRGIISDRVCQTILTRQKQQG